LQIVLFVRLWHGSAFSILDKRIEEIMPSRLLEGAVTKRVPIALIVSYLKTCSETNVKELIARRLATGVFHADSDEVVYWAAVHHAYLGTALDSDLHLDVLECLSKTSTPGH
jgi:hypothetical protein